MNTFKPIDDRNHLSNIVSGEIEKAILARKYMPGARLLTEAELCNQFNVSRTVVREALQTLSARGLIRVEKGRGVFVEQFSSKAVTNPFYLFLELSSNSNKVIDVLKIRQMIEPEVAGLAAINSDVKDLQRLRSNLLELQNANNDVRKIARLDMEFHLILASASGNRLIQLILEPIHRLMPKIKSAVMKSVEDAKSSALAGHAKILAEIENRNASGAVAAMKQHLVHAEEHMKIMLMARMKESRLDTKSGFESESGF